MWQRQKEAKHCVRFHFGSDIFSPPSIFSSHRHPCYDAAQIGFAPNHPQLLSQRFQKLWHLDEGHTTQLWTEFATVLCSLKQP